MSRRSTKIEIVQRGEEGHFLSAALGWLGHSLSITDRPSDKRYFVSVSVLDFVRLGFDFESGRLRLLESQDIRDIQSGRAALLLDLSNEGPYPHLPAFDGLHRDLERLGIDRQRVALICQNRKMQEGYERIYGVGLRFWTFEFFPLQIALWLDETVGPRIFSDRPPTLDTYIPFQRAQGKPKFLCQNAALRWHRVLLYRWLQLNGMNREGNISFHGVGADNPKAGGINVLNAPMNITTSFGYLITDIEEWIPRKAQLLDVSAQGNDLVITIDTDAYHSSDMTIISETDFFEIGVQRITEKSIKAAAMGLPFVVVGASWSVARLSELGFCTFGGIVDHHYDTIEEPTERMKQIFTAIDETWKFCRNDNLKYRVLAKEQAISNVKHGRNGLLGQLKRIMVQPVLDKMERFVESETGAF